MALGIRQAGGRMTSNSDVHLVTIREVGVGAVLLVGHPLHQIDIECRARRLPVHLVHSIAGRDALDRRYGRRVHRSSCWRRQRVAITSISTE